MPMWWSGGDDTLPVAEVERTAKDVSDIVVESALLLKDYSAVMIDVDGGDYFGYGCCNVVDDRHCGCSFCNS